MTIPRAGQRPRRYVKLDAARLNGFDRALGDRVRVIRTGLPAVAAGLWREGGARAMLRACWRALATGKRHCGALVEDNIVRKSVRLPTVIGRWFARGPYARLKYVEASLLRDYLRAILDDRDAVALIFNGAFHPESVLEAVAREQGLSRLFVEIGFFPGTLQIDPVGLNANNSVPRDPLFYLDAAAPITEDTLPAQVNVRAAKAKEAARLDLPGNYVFVPFQVPSDTQVTQHSPWIGDMEAFVDVVRAAAERHPDEVFVIKEHPSFRRSVRHVRPPHPRVLFANGNPTPDLIAGARAVITLNSTVGLEALLFGKPVIVLGDACYDVPGLVLRARSDAEIDAALARSRQWRPDPRLRHRFLAYLYGTYLVHARFEALPPDFANLLDSRVAMVPGRLGATES